MTADQRQLFDTQPEPWEADDQSQATGGVGRAFGGAVAQSSTISCPTPCATTVELGRRVKVPLGAGNRLVVGYCVRLEDRPAGRRRLKPLHSVLDQRSLLSPAMLRLTRWIADHYLCDWAAVLGRRGAGRRAHRRRHADDHAALGRRATSPNAQG